MRASFFLPFAAAFFSACTTASMGKDCQDARTGAHGEPNYLDESKVTLLALNQQEAYAKLAIPRLGSCHQNSEPLIFQLHHLLNDVDESKMGPLRINGALFQPVNDDDVRAPDTHAQGVSVDDVSGARHPVDITAIWGQNRYEMSAEGSRQYQEVEIVASLVDDSTPCVVSFVLQIARDVWKGRRLGKLVHGPSEQMVDLTQYGKYYEGRVQRNAVKQQHSSAKAFTDENSAVAEFEDNAFPAAKMSDEQVLDAEMELLTLLESQAQQIRAKMEAHGRQPKPTTRDAQRLREECDSIVCSAHIITVRVAARLGIDPRSIALPQAQTLLSDFPPSVKPPPDARICSTTPSPPPSWANHLAPPQYESIARPLPPNLAHPNPARPILPQPHYPSTADHRHRKRNNILIAAFSSLATLLGLSALFAFLRRKCAGARRRVERAADAEQRSAARAYRRAARRNAFRQRWTHLVSGLNCFSGSSSTHPSSALTPEQQAEEKATLLRPADADDPQDLAEKGEAVAAELAALRGVRDVVAALVPRPGGAVGAERSPYSSPTSSMGSTTTLPSYKEDEVLPEYSSRDVSLRTPSLMSDEGTGTGTGSEKSEAITPGSSEWGARAGRSGSEGGRSGVSSESSSTRTGFTPTSSVLTVSPRPSSETLETMWDGGAGGT